MQLRYRSWQRVRSLWHDAFDTDAISGMRLCHASYDASAYAVTNLQMKITDVLISLRLATFERHLMSLKKPTCNPPPHNPQTPTPTHPPTQNKIYDTSTNVPWVSRDTNFVSNRQDLTNPSHNMWTAPKNEDDTAEVMRIITMVMHCRAVSGISFMQGEQHSGERGGQFIITSPLFQPRIGKRWNIEIKPKSSEVGGDQTKNTESESMPQFWPRIFVLYII